MLHSASNLVVLRGTMTDDPSTRDLADGTVVVQFDLATRRADDAGTISVPVAWHDPSPSGRAAIGRDAEVVVVGVVRRRFFRSGGATQSRTEVVADRVIPASRSKTVRSVLAGVVDALEG